MIFDKPIIIQKMNETEEWADTWKLHASVNKTNGGEEFTSGATRSTASLTFEVRYFKALKDISLSNELYRLIYDGNIYNIVDYDDYMELHKTVKLVGEFYGKN